MKIHVIQKNVYLPKNNFNGWPSQKFTALINDSLFGVKYPKKFKQVKNCTGFEKGLFIHERLSSWKKIWVHINKHIIFVCFLPGGLGEPKWINVQEVVNIQKDNKETIPDGEREQVETYS